MEQSTECIIELPPRGRHGKQGDDEEQEREAISLMRNVHILRRA